MDFAKLLINYNESVFKGRFTGYVYGTKNATVRLLGTSTTVTTDDGGKFAFEAVPGLNAVRASAKGYVEDYDFGESCCQPEPYGKLNYTKPATFADDNQISSWAKDSVYFMAANNIINGVGGNKFAPKNTTPAEEAAQFANATREQALLIAARMVENLK